MDKDITTKVHQAEARLSPELVKIRTCNIPTDTGELHINGYSFVGLTPLTSYNLAKRLAPIFNNSPSVSLIVETIKALNGMFWGVWISTNKETIIAFSDKFGSMPLYYTTDSGTINFSEDYWKLQSSLKKSTIDNLSVIQLLRSHYVWNESTIFKEIKELPSASIITWNKQKNGNYRLEDQTRYWSYNLAKNSSHDSLLINEAEGILNNVIQRTKNMLTTLHTDVGLNLTSGGDSRLMAFSLLNSNLNITAYTSFSKNESAALNIAERLKIPHVLLPSWESSINSPPLTLLNQLSPTTMYEVTNHMINLDSHPKLCKKNQLSLSGHLGDFAAGAHYTRSIRRLSTLNRKTALRLFINNNHFHYSNEIKNWLRPEYNDLWDNTVELTATEIEQKNYKNETTDSFLNQVDLDNRQRKFILRDTLANRSLFGQTFLPFADNEYWEFFQKVPRKLLNNRRLFHRACENIYKNHPSKLNQFPVNGTSLKLQTSRLYIIKKAWILALHKITARYQHSKNKSNYKSNEDILNIINNLDWLIDVNKAKIDLENNNVAITRHTISLLEALSSITSKKLT